jgi:hypothetical protein
MKKGSNAAIAAAALSGSSGDDALHQLRAICGRLTSAVGTKPTSNDVRFEVAMGAIADMAV